MAKKSFVLSNDDGRVSFSNTSSVSIDDGITTGITGAISASQLYVTTLTASSLGTTNPTGSFLSASSTGILARSTLTGSFSSGALGWNGSAIVATNVIPGDYSGISATNTDISGNYSDDIKVVGIGNVFSGSLPVAFGGTGLTGSQYAASNRLILKVSGSTAPVISTLSASASGTIIASGEGRFNVQSPSYQPDVRFYGTPGTYTWTRPIGARFARVILQGAGGGGSGGKIGTNYLMAGNGGGAGGFSDVIVDVSNISTSTIIIGLGGAGGNASSTTAGNVGTNGGTTSWLDLFAFYYAYGGSGGAYATSPGVAAGGYGLTKNGGNGAPAGASLGPAQTTYGVPSGGGKGYATSAGAGATNGGTIIPMLDPPNKNFGYLTDSIGINILTTLSSGSNGASVGTTPAANATLGAGGGGGAGNSTVGLTSAGGNGGNGYALIISW